MVALRVVLISIAAFVVVAIMLTRSPGEPGSPSDPSDNHTGTCSPKGDTMAWVMAQEFVRRQLKSPSTAEFPTYWGTSPGIHALHLGGCKFEVIGYVDAQNSFGATLRTNYLAELEYLPASNTWQGTAELFE